MEDMSMRPEIKNRINEDRNKKLEFFRPFFDRMDGEPLSKPSLLAASSSTESQSLLLSCLGRPGRKIVEKFAIVWTLTNLKDRRKIKGKSRKNR
jgi:hypothetical protein